MIFPNDADENESSVYADQTAVLLALPILKGYNKDGLSGQFFPIFEIKFFWFVVTTRCGGC